MKDSDEPLSLVSSDNNIPLIKRSTRICYMSNRYGVVAHYITFYVHVAQSIIWELFSYQKTVYFSKALFYRQVTDKKIRLLYKIILNI